MRTLGAPGLGVLVALFVSVSASAVSTAAPSTLSHSTLRSMFPGTFAVRVQGMSAKFIASSGGRLTGESLVGTDSGYWSVRSGRLCIMLRDWLGGETRCSAVVREGGWYRAESVLFRRI